MDFYEILQVNQNASYDEIRKSYRRLAKMYHPDKNNDIDSKEKFQKINLAYEMLSNDKNRTQYSKLNSNQKNQFIKFLEYLLNNFPNIQILKSFGINFDNYDINYLEKLINNDIFNKLNLGEILEFFKSGNVVEKNFNFEEVCSDTDTDSWSKNDSLYFYSLPLEFNKINDYNLIINLKVELTDVLLKKNKTITLKRKINDEFINTTFSFDLSHPYIVFSGGGDIDGDSVGNLIIKLDLGIDYIWNEEMIVFVKRISLYQFVYGLNLNFKINKQDKIYYNYVPSRDGNFLTLDNKDINLVIKFVLEYNHSDDKENLLKEYFN